MNALQRLEETLDEFSKESPVITVSRKDLVELIESYKFIQKGREEDSSDKRKDTHTSA